MFKNNLFETLIGFLVIILAVAFAIFVYDNAKNSYEEKDGVYIVSASFQNVDGIIKGSDVIIAGIKIGSVHDMSIDNKTYQAILKIEISKNISIPIDSKASILSSGFVGNKFISIEPGIEDKMMKNGDTIAYTTSALNLETLIGKLMYSFGNKVSQ